MEDNVETSAQRSLTYGEKAVGLTFNPSNDDAVDHVNKSMQKSLTD